MLIEQTQTFSIRPVNDFFGAKFTETYRKKKNIKLILLHQDSFDNILKYLQDFKVKPAPSNYLLGIFVHHKEIIKKYKNIVSPDETNISDGKYDGIKRDRFQKKIFYSTYEKSKGYFHDDYEGYTWIAVIPEEGEDFLNDEIVDYAVFSRQEPLVQSEQEVENLDSWGPFIRK